MPQKGAFITSKVDTYAIAKRINQHIENAKLQIIKKLAYIGEQCVKTAREKGSYNDITGNLRSSIGYVILQDGQPIIGGGFGAVDVPEGTRKVKRVRQTKSGPKEYLATVKIGGNGAEGVKAGESLLARLQADFPTGIVLIVCAGMKYAAYVENIHHKDVLASAELKAQSLIKRLLKGLID